jgi:hypothetical protein
MFSFGGVQTSHVSHARTLSTHHVVAGRVGQGRQTREYGRQCSVHGAQSISRSRATRVSANREGPGSGGVPCRASPRRDGGRVEYSRLHSHRHHKTRYFIYGHVLRANAQTGGGRARRPARPPRRRPRPVEPSEPEPSVVLRVACHLVLYTRVAKSNGYDLELATLTYQRQTRALRGAHGSLMAPLALVHRIDRPATRAVECRVVKPAVPRPVTHLSAGARPVSSVRVRLRVTYTSLSVWPFASQWPPQSARYVDAKERTVSVAYLRANAPSRPKRRRTLQRKGQQAQALRRRASWSTVQAT